MLDGLLRILTGLDDADRAGERNDPAFALAVLLIEVARSDDKVEAANRASSSARWPGASACSRAR